MSPEPPAVTVTPLDQAGAVIAGGSTGVGLATAVGLAAAGVPRIALLARSPERGAAACERVRAASPGVEVTFVAFDALDLASTQAAAATAREAVGAIDVLVNSVAGPVTPTLLLRTPVEAMAGVLDAVVLPALHLTRIVLPWMAERGGGSIVTVASDAGKTATPGESLIGAGMAALAMFDRVAALEAKRTGVRVNTVTPSLIAGTPTTERIMQDPFTQKLFGKAAQMADLGVPDAADVAALIVFLSSPAAARVTGQTVSVNGGISAA